MVALEPCSGSRGNHRNLIFLPSWKKGVEIVGAVPSGLPCFSIPYVGIQDFSLVFPLAMALFLLSYVELTTIARMYAKTRNYEIDTD